MEIKSCKNCDHELKLTDLFCSNCGQKTKEDLTMGILFYNTISNYFSVDARFFKSFIPLLLRPGYLAKKFIEGKRLLFLHPAQFYLFTSIVFFFLFSFQSREYSREADTALKSGFTNENLKKLESTSNEVIDSIASTGLPNTIKGTQINLSEQNKKDLEKLDSIIKEGRGTKNKWHFNNKELDSLIAIDAPEEAQLKALGISDNPSFIEKHFYTQILKFQKNSGGGILQAFFDSIPISLFILLPIFAFILKLFFWKKGNYPLHLVFSFYHFSFLFVIFSIALLFNFAFEISIWLNSILVLLTFIYLFLGIKIFYHQKFITGFFKTSLIVFVYSIFVLPIALGIMIVASFLLY